MLKRDSQKYIRYMNESIDDDDHEQGRLEPDDDLEQGHEHEALDQSHQMQEGRRVLAMMTPRVSEQVQPINKGESGRIVCMMVLTTVLCFIGGTLFGYVVGGRSLHGGTYSLNGTCPKGANIPDGGVTQIPEKVSTSFPGQIPEEVLPMASHFLSHMTPDLIKNHTRNMSEMGADEIRNYVRAALKSEGFVVEENFFPVITSLANQEDPNTVVIVYENGTSILANEPTQSLHGFSPFSPFSPNGSIAGTLVYANFARDEDFETLEENGLNITGCILLVRLCYLHPGVQVRNAEERGAAGVILYPDPKDFGGENKPPEPATQYKGSGLPSDGIVWQSLRMIPGDPSTPNIPSQKDIYRIAPDQYSGMTSMLVQPVSAETGHSLLDALNGTEVPESWKGSLKVNYTFGGSFKEAVKEVQLKTNNVLAEKHSHVILAYLPAQDHSKVIHVGCHYELRDGHLTSSGIGLASLLALSTALKKTYPDGTDRLVAFTAFEGKDGDSSAGNEYSQLYRWWLESSGMAYIDMDELLEGKGFVEAHVSPILREVARRALDHVAWVGKEGLTVREGLTDNLPFHLNISPDGKNREYQASFHFKNPYECDESINFVNVHGIPALKLTSVHLNKSKDFHLKNSQYDTVETVIATEDEDFLWTHMIASVMGVSVLILSSTQLPPAKFDEVGWDINNAWRHFISYEKDSFDGSTQELHDLTDRISMGLDNFRLTCESYDTWFKNGENLDIELPLSQKFRMLESRLSTFVQFGRRFLRPRNVPGHSVFGSLLTYGPSAVDPCEGDYFPFLKKALRDVHRTNGSWDSVIQELSLILSSLADFRTFT